MNKRNLVPVSVWKQVNRNFSVSRTSSPVAGMPGLGYVWVIPGAVPVGVGVPGAPPVVPVDVVVDVGVREGSLGVRERVIAWTLLFFISVIG